MTFVPATLLPDSAPARARIALDSPELAQSRERIDAYLRDYLVRQRADYLGQPVFAPLYDDLVEFVCRQGKRLRPLLFLLAHRLFQSESAEPPVPDEGLLAVAASLELLHAFILIHDDVIDRAETRRHLPTLHRLIEGRLSSFSDRGRAGRNLALVLGDILFALAQKCLLDGPLPPAARARLGSMLLGCMVETGFGEVADIVYGTRDVAKVNPAEIEQMYCLKTTCYTVEGPLAMAASLHGADRAEIEAIGRIARPAGLAFQIQNDLQEFARFEVSDAEAPADMVEGKKTLLVRAAFDLLGESDQGLLQICFSAGTPTEGTISKARELVIKSGAIGALNFRMNALFRTADEEISRSPFSDRVRAGLAGLVQLVRGAAAGG